MTRKLTLIAGVFAAALNSSVAFAATELTVYTAVGVFALLALWVTVAGFRDIQRMLAELREQREDDPPR